MGWESKTHRCERPEALHLRWESAGIGSVWVCDKALSAPRDGCGRRWRVVEIEGDEIRWELAQPVIGVTSADVAFSCATLEHR